jgi:hypothetical protein
MQKNRVLRTGSLRLKQMKHHLFSRPLASHKHGNSSNKVHSDVWTSRGRFKIKFALSRWQWRCLRIAAGLNRRHQSAVARSEGRMSSSNGNPELPNNESITPLHSCRTSDSRFMPISNSTGRLPSPVQFSELPHELFPREDS